MIILPPGSTFCLQPLDCGINKWLKNHCDRAKKDLMMENVKLNQYCMPKVIAKAVQHINANNQEGVKKVFVKTGASLDPEGTGDEIFAVGLSGVTGYKNWLRCRRLAPRQRVWRHLGVLAKGGGKFVFNLAHHSVQPVFEALNSQTFELAVVGDVHVLVGVRIVILARFKFCLWFRLK